MPVFLWSVLLVVASVLADDPIDDGADDGDEADPSDPLKSDAHFIAQGAEFSEVACHLCDEFGLLVEEFVVLLDAFLQASDLLIGAEWFGAIGLREGGLLFAAFLYFGPQGEGLVAMFVCEFRGW